MNRPSFRDDPAREVAVVGLGKSGRAAAELLARDGVPVYASDAGRGPAALAAAERLAALGVSVETGGHDLPRIARASLVVASPGIPPQAPPLRAARDAGVRVVGELEIALRYLPGLRYAAITGTNGKTTTTALVGHILRTLGHDAVDAGNIGTPLADLALRDEPPGWCALETSSFQLHDTPGLAPTVGVVTNLSPDHLDRYPDVRSYYADKARIFCNARPESRWVLNGDQPEVLRLHELRDSPRAATLLGTVHTFSLERQDADAWYDRDGGRLMLLGEPLLDRGELRLAGDHNVANALCAALAVVLMDDAHRAPAARERISAALRSFRALAHRLEPVGEWGDVVWINDSKATNVSSTLVAVAGMTRPTVVLLGGRHKGEPYTALLEPLRAHAKAVLAYGEAAGEVERDLGAHLRVERMGSDFREILSRARAIAAPGDAILLSPACSSYDMFDNYEHRGAEFRRLAAELGTAS